MNSPAPSDRQRVVITAGASGIGLATAQAFLRQGAQVYICDIDASMLERALADNTGLQGAISDVGDPQQVESFFTTVKEALGGIDVLVNNAGVGGPRASVEHISYDDWDSCIRINLSGMFYCVKQVIPTMKQQGSGCIINISTGSAKTGLPNRLPYVASKVGVLGLSHNLARELGPYNIRCNTLLPGLMDNPRGRKLVANYAEETGLSLQAAEQDFLKYISQRCWIQPTEIAEAALFLASASAKHITAQEISVDGNFEWEQ
ncbi:SDR family oxidoreductase [SAR92 clade bacterium H246]